MRKSFLLLLVIIAGLTQTTQAQLFDQNPEMLTRKDTLRGSLRPERTCYDVTYYDLKVEVDIKVIYEGTSLRPSAFEIKYKIDGEQLPTKKISNIK